MNYYELLQIKSTAKTAEIDLAYKKAITLYHPDNYPGNVKFSEDMMRSLDAAFNILSDIEKRKNYDNWLNLQAEELYGARSAKLKDKKINQTIKRFESSINFLKEYLGQKKSLTIIFIAISLFLTFFPFQNSINSIFKQTLLGEPIQHNKTSKLNTFSICNSKKIIGDANGDGFFSYSDIPQLSINLYQNLGKSITRELTDTKVGTFLEIRGNSCNSAVVTIISTLVWVMIVSILFYAAHFFWELLKLIVRTLFFNKANRVPSRGIARSIYIGVLPKAFKSARIRYIAYIFLALGIFNYFKFNNLALSHNKIQIPGKGSGVENPSSSKRDPKEKKNQSETSDYYFLALNLVNEVRAKGADCGGKYFQGTSPLRLNDALINAARIHAINMAEMHFFSHTGMDGKSSSARISEQGYRWSVAGENIAAGQSSIKEAVNGWIKSPGHCANLMDPRFTEMGISKASSSGAKYKIYWVQTFAAPSY